VINTSLDVETPSGAAWARVDAPENAAGLLVLGHGAGGGIDAADLAGCARELTAAGWAVARVEQPYRVAGRRAPARAPALDAAWTAVVAALRGRWGDGPLVVGGRSSGARVACRTAAEVGAAAVVCLAFPLRPPWRPEASRADELTAVTVPTLVVQGERDQFGTPAAVAAAAPTAVVVAVEGDHALRAGGRVGAVVRQWLVEQRLGVSG
jgi:predicted alpha/beta-hydrolase family hydrolase